MHIDLFADVVCPWCYIGTAELRTALSGLPFADEVSVRMRSFQLDPSAPAQPQPLGAILGAKYGPQAVEQMVATVAERGREAGIEIALDPVASSTGNTANAHRVLAAAWDAGVQPDVAQAIYRAYFSERRSIFDEESLREVVAPTAMPSAALDAAFTDPVYAQRVAEDGAAARTLGIRGVPFFVIDDAYGVSGAQPAAVLREVLQQVHGRSLSA